MTKQLRGGVRDDVVVRCVRDAEYWAASMEYDVWPRYLWYDHAGRAGVVWTIWSVQQRLHRVTSAVEGAA